MELGSSKFTKAVRKGRQNGRGDSKQEGRTHRDRKELDENTRENQGREGIYTGMELGSWECVKDVRKDELKER